MTDDRIELTRRKILASATAVGAAGAVTGFGTSALFSDQETFTNNQLIAGELDMVVGFEEHYSNWSDDEDEGLDGAVTIDPNGTTGEAAVGLPTQEPINGSPLIALQNASDAEQFLDNTIGESPDSGDTAMDRGPAGFDAATVEADTTPCDSDLLASDLERPTIQLTDVKPGDFGEVTFSFALCDNPGFVWLIGRQISASENGKNEPERNDPNEGAGVELLDAVQTAIWIDDGNNYQNANESPVFTGTLREALDALDPGTAFGNTGQAQEGLLLPGDILAKQGGGQGTNCFAASETHSVAVAWWVPRTVGNEIQSDSVTFDLGFYTEQCRNNSAQGGVSDWVQTAKLTATPASADSYFGSAVSVGNPILAVGADGTDTSGNNAGTVFIFDKSDGWNQTAQLRPTDGTAGDYFGEAVAVEAESVVVGAPGDDDTGNNAGAAYIFEKSNGNWTETKLTAGGQGASFGQSVAIASETVAIGADGVSQAGQNEVGAVYIFTPADNGWSQTATLSPSTSTAQAYFGVRTAINTSGDRLVVSAYGDDRNGENAGAVYIFEWQNGWSQTAVLTPSDGAPNDHFGSAIDIHDETIVVGAFGADDGGTDTGAAYVFNRTNTGWTETAKLTASDRSKQDFFGWMTAIHSDTILVGAYREDGRGVNAGAAYIYQLQDGAWTEVSKLTADDASDSARFGVAGDLRNDNIVVAATGDAVNGPNSGATYLFQS